LTKGAKMATNNPLILIFDALANIGAVVLQAELYEQTESRLKELEARRAKYESLLGHESDMLDEGSDEPD